MSNHGRPKPLAATKRKQRMPPVRRKFFLGDDSIYQAKEIVEFYANIEKRPDILAEIFPPSKAGRKKRAQAVEALKRADAVIKKLAPIFKHRSLRFEVPEFELRYLKTPPMPSLPKGRLPPLQMKPRFLATDILAAGGISWLADCLASWKRGDGRPSEWVMAECAQELNKHFKKKILPSDIYDFMSPHWETWKTLFPSPHKKYKDSRISRILNRKHKSGHRERAVIFSLPKEPFPMLTLEDRKSRRSKSLAF